MSSNVPSSQFTAEEQRAIERSKQAIDLATTISSGEQPSNVQIKKVIAAGKAGLEEVKMQSELQGTLYPEGEQFVKDTKALLTDAQILLDEKNRDEKFQKFVSDAQRLVDMLKVQAPIVGKRVQRAMGPHAGRLSDTFEEYLPEQRELLSRTVTYMRVLLTQLVRSGEFRTLVADTIDLMRSLFIGGTEQLQKSVDSTMSQLQQNIQSGKPILSTPYTAQQGPEKYQTFQQPSSLTVTSTSTNLGTQPLRPTSTVAAGEKGKWPAQQQSQFSRQDQQLKHDTQKLVDKFVDILARYANKKEFAEAFRAELDMLSSFQANVQGEAREMAETVKATTSDIWANPQFRFVYEDAINILEAFIGTNTWTPFWDSFMRWVNFIQYDTRTRTYFNEWRGFFTEALDKPEVLSNSQFRSRMVDLIDRGQTLSTELKWSNYTQDVFDKAQKMVENVLNDPLLNRISADTQKLLSNLMTNEQGNLAFKPELMQQIRDMFVSLFAQQLKFIPLPEIRDVADLALGKYEYILKNVVFRAEDILPEHMRIRTVNDMDFNVKSFTTNAARTDVYIKIDHIVTKLQNVEFWFRRLSTPTMEDSGYVDIDMTGQGLEIVAHVIINPPSQQPIFDVQRIQCTVHDLSLKTKESKHDTIYNVVSGLFSGTLKRYIQEKIETELSNNIAMLNQNLNQLIQVMPQQQGIGDIVTQQLKSAVGIEEQQPATIGKKAAIV